MANGNTITFQTDKDIAIEELTLALGVLDMYPKTNEERVKSIKRVIEYLKDGQQ